MKVRYVAVWEFKGGNTIAGSVPSREVARLREPALIATLVADPEPYIEHFDRASAGAAFVFFGGRRKGGDPEEQLNAAITDAMAQRARNAKQGVYVVFEGQTNDPNPKLAHRQDFRNFSVALGAIDKDAVVSSFRPVVRSILVALSLSLPINADRRIRKLGEVSFLVDQETGRPIYPIDIQFPNMRGCIAVPISEDFVSQSAERIPQIVGDEVLARCTGLLSTSMNPEAGPLLAFLAGWTALEMFTHYCCRAIHGTDDGNESPMAKHIADRFRLVVRALDAPSEEADTQEFGRLNKIRNAIFHALRLPEQLPTDDVQKLVLKYLRLHLDSRA